jgi:hypothetical protein
MNMRNRKAKALPSVTIPMLAIALLATLVVSAVARGSTTTTNSATSTTTRPHPPRCSRPGTPCGTCGPAGQCLDHVDQAPPAHVCVNGGFCVQVGCGADADCPPHQVCATLATVNACCATCP